MALIDDFKDMVSRGILPNTLAYTYLVRAFIALRMFDDAKATFEKSIEVYTIPLLPQQRKPD